jgi:23S rRNA (adenine2503-C2)-methyltransferase
MGMGEPLLNLDNVLRSIRILTDEIGMSMRRITVSTVGVIRGIEKLAKENLALTLAVSLHAATDELRVQIVPSHKTISIDRLMDSCRAYFDTTGRRITFEYVLLSNVNDQPLHAHQLAKLLRGFPCAVNLIPWNPISESGYVRPKPEDIRAFRSILEDAGIECTQRKERGRHIDAACGQLATMAHNKMPSPRPSLVLEV